MTLLCSLPGTVGSTEIRCLVRYSISFPVA